ncbi:MAG: hypothetical protein WDO74_17965 [Pseudomonadota bacterium]
MPPDLAPETPAIETTAVAPAKNIPNSSEVIGRIVAAAAKDEAEASDPVPKVETKASKKADPKAVKIDLDKPEAEAKPEPEPEVAREKARYHLQHGDVAKAIETAFGNLEGIAIPDDVREALARKLGVDSRGWEKFRKHEQATKRQLAAKEAEVSQLVQRTLKEFEPFHLGRQAYEAGDYETAFKHAFGEDLADFQRKIISQRVGKNPEVEAVKAELERERQARQDFERRLQDERTQAEATHEIRAYVAQLGADLAESEDAHIREYSKRPRFVGRVFEILRDNYDSRTNTSIPFEHAAAAARDEVLALLNEWEYSGGSPAKADQASALPEQPPLARARVRNLKHASAAEATASPRKLSREERIAKYTKLMAQAHD